MGVFEIVSLVMNCLLGGGLIVTLSTLRSTRAKSAAEAHGVEIDNEDKINKMVNDYLVEPLKKEITYLRRDISKLRKSIERIPECPHSAECPVKESLKEFDKQDEN